MANEFNVTYTSGLGASSMYATVHNQLGQVWNTNTPGFENWNSTAEGNEYYKHDSPNYISENGTGGSGIYVGDIDSTFTNAASDKYIVKIYIEGGDPSTGDDDTFIGADTLYWNGSAEIEQTEYDLEQIGLGDTVVSGVATNLKQGLAQLWRRFFKKVTKNSSTNKIETYSDLDASITEQTYSEGDTDTVGDATNP